MTYFEECLTLGSWLSREDKQALYKYLLLTKSGIYESDAEELLANQELKSFIANGEIKYSIDGRRLNFSARENGSDSYSIDLRTLKLGLIRSRNIGRIKKFFAQTEVDVISNFPLPSADSQVPKSINIFSYPFYDLNYYSNGKGRLLGLVKKLQSSDELLLTKLIAS